MRPEAGKQPAGNEGADDADDDVADQAEAAARHDLAGKPAGNGTDDEKDDECLWIHASAPLCGGRRQ